MRHQPKQYLRGSQVGKSPNQVKQWGVQNRYPLTTCDSSLLAFTWCYSSIHNHGVAPLSAITSSPKRRQAVRQEVIQ